MVAPLEIVDTAVKIGLGAVVGGASTYLLERLKQQNEYHKERLRLRRDKIIDPIVAFMDDLLVSISEAYWTHLDHIEGSAREKVVVEFRKREAVVEARIAALQNDELSQTFSELTGQLFKIRTELDDDRIVLARNEMRRTFQLAGTVLTMLFEVQPSSLDGAPRSRLSRLGLLRKSKTHGRVEQ
jgi:hypothetical protein